ncbi:MAG: heavy metal translocating P-type ATPase [Acutalibacteraceae bacterium]|nr:heavy metal translocating P-type ATPase [Acutalibacteraceae bacterium]
MSRKQKKKLIRIIVAAVLLVVISFLSFDNIIMLFLYIVPYLVVGWDVVFSAVRNIIHGQLFDEQFLMALATIGAFGSGEYREAVAVMLFYQIGELFQGIAVGKSRKSIASLMDIRPDSAVVIRDGAEIKVSPEEVQKGETIIVRPGEKIPLDGTVLTGSTTVNTAALTGESLPRDIEEGGKVISGSVNLTGVITVKTESLYAESTVAKILDLVENSSAKKAKTENFITRFAKYYTPCVVAAALALAFIPPLIVGNFGEWIQRALIFLVVSCPCALVISVPLSFFGGIGGASRKGILVKGSNYMEVLSKVGTVVFDKTGTLTKGSFTVTAIHPEKLSEDELLDVAAAAESYSNHPIAESIIAAHKGHIDQSRIGEVKEHAGMGIEAVIDGRDIFAGNGKLMDMAGARWHNCHIDGTVIHISEGSCYLGHIVISDEIKPDSKEALKELKKLGVAKTVMLTGDRKEIAASVGKTLGLDEVHAELLPDGKVKAVESLIKEGRTLAFVGDGINDAPVLARADLGVAMGAMGSDAAIEAADLVLMDDKPSKLPDAIKIARKTMRIIWQNIVFSLIVKAAVLILAALGFANMWLAIFADIGVTVLAILNAMRAMKTD